MKIRIASDLHLEFINKKCNIPDLGSADILILAGGYSLCQAFQNRWDTT